MNAYLNYIIEANLGLVLFFTCYKLLLSKEMNFGVLRFVLLVGIFISLILPLIHVETSSDRGTLSIGTVIPSYWLPEVVVGSKGTVADSHEASFNFWRFVSACYIVALMILFGTVLMQLLQLIRIIRAAKTYRSGNLYIAESPEDKPIFSFFNFIFIGRANQLSTIEKGQIIRHESVHARQWHSFDILLMNLLKILFWFNPLISSYKKTFIQLHEFEADARAVENSDMDKYCSLLAKVALQSEGYTLANHFNNSLTVKRIEMMRTIKTNIKRWKLVAVACMLPLVFFFIACQDQVGDDIIEIAQNSTHALIVPEHIQARYEQLKKENPTKKYALLELNETASGRLAKLKDEYGLPRHVEVFNGADEKLVAGSDVLKMLSESKESSYLEFIVTEAESKKAGHTYAIIEFTEQTSKLATASGSDNVFTVVEEQPEFPGGYDSMMVFIRRNLRYPAEARQKGLEGTVYTTFIVEKDGSVTDVKTIRGISPDTDAEAARVIQLFPKWSPGKQSGEIVRVRFVMPIKYKLSN